jgi:hypothetical protein
MTNKFLFLEYDYNRGGLGDLWKGGFLVFCISKFSDRIFSFDLRPHIIDKLYSITDIVKDNVYDDTKIIFNEYSYIPLGMIIDDIKSSTKKCIKMICNRWRHEIFLSREMNIRDLISEYNKLFQKQFSINHHSLIEKYNLHEKFIVFHCRCGDMYLNESTQLFKSDNRISSFELLEKKIQFFNSIEKNDKIMICGDSESIVKMLLSKIPNSFTISPKPHHFAFHSNESHLVSIQNTFEEHALISKAKSIYMCVYSGYPLTAALENDIPVYLIGENELSDYYKTGRDDTYYINQKKI